MVSLRLSFCVELLVLLVRPVKLLLFESEARTDHDRSPPRQISGTKRNQPLDFEQNTRDKGINEEKHVC